jgi:DamX protein
MNFAKNHGISPPFAIFERDLKGAPWFSLVAGDYPDRAAAVAARARLPAALSGAGVWPRTFASIQSAR